MKRISIAIAASALIASAAHAAFDVTVDVDSTSYLVGDLVTIDLTLTTAGDHTVDPFGVLEYQAAWDPAVFEVANAPSGVSPNGNSTQTVFPQLSGSATPACFAPGGGDGPAGTNACVTLSQVNAGFTTVTINGVATAQLILHILGAPSYSLMSEHLTIGLETGTETADSITIGPNYQVANAPGPIVPEPTTAALIGLGLVGLGAAGRRR